MLNKIHSRWQAFGIHLAISLVIFLILLSLILFVWFPGVFINMGGYQGIKIVAGVDLVLGPLLTLIIFNPKKSLRMIRFDLLIIGLIQISALTAGTYLVYLERPLVQVISDDGVYIHTHSDFKSAEIDTKILESFSTPFPKVIFLDLPEKQSERNLVKTVSEFADGKPITMRADLYIDINKVDSKLLQNRLESFEFKDKDSCFVLPVESFHASEESCFSPKKGIKYLIET